MMTAKQRILTALERGRPDTIPVSPFIVMRFAYRMTGRKDWRGFFQTHKKIGTTPFNMKIPINFDVNLKPGWSKSIDKMVGSEKSRVDQMQGKAPFWGDISGPLYDDPEAEERWQEETKRIDRSHKTSVTTMHIGTPRGRLVSQKQEGFIPEDPLVPKITDYLVKERKDYEIYLAYLEEWVNSATPRVRQLDEAVEELGEDGVFTVWVYNIFSDLAQGGREMQELFLDLYDEPQLMREVWQTFRRLKEKEIQAFNESKAEVLIYDQGWTSQDLISPKFFEQWLLPDLMWAAENIREDKYLGFYQSGKVTDLLPMMVEAGPAFIETFDPIGDNISLGEAKKRYGDRVCLMGNFNSFLLAQGDQEDARRETVRCIEEGAGSGGYILGTAGEVPVDAKIENLNIMVDVTRRYAQELYGSDHT